MLSKLRLAFPAVAALVLGAITAAGAGEPPPARDSALNDVTQGALRFKNAEGRFVECPLKHTGVEAEIAGFIARVKVTQEFHNPSKERIEAVYVFPLPHESAVDGMTMKVCGRTIVGVIKRRTEARRIYQKALEQGQTAALLEQERPNIFVQRVGNIEPGGSVHIEITYADVLSYDLGMYTFHFPMVVGPRYNPAGWKDKIAAVPAGSPASAASGGGVAVPYLKPEQRSGHDISLSLTLDAGVPVQDIRSVNHKVKLKQTGKHTAACSIRKDDSIPNKDFELKYKVIGDKPEAAVLAHADSGRDGYFLLMVQPREDAALLKAPPREVVFLVDVSGSMSGQPTAKVKQAMKLFLERSSPRDKIQVVTFAGAANKLFPQPVECTEENVKKALGFAQNYGAGGGTEMLKGIQMALGEPPDGERVRIVIMLTDGFIGNEAEIIQEVGRRCGDKIRFWCLGIGTSVNRFLVDGVAKQGGGMGKVLSLNSTEAEVKDLVDEVVVRIHRAQIANLAVNWSGLEVRETYPARIPELWAGRPVVVFGRYAGGGKARIRLSGEAEGHAVSFEVPVELPRKEPRNDVLAVTWARRKIESLSDEMTVQGATPDLVEQVTNIALEHRLMTAYTSFVAVDEEKLKAQKPQPPPRQVAVPVPVPEGVKYETTVGPSKVEETDNLETDAGVAPGQEDAVSDIPLGGMGMVGSIGVGGGGLAGAFGYRDGGGRKKAVARYGGSAASESVVEGSLLWLARHQEADGSWDARKSGAAEDCRGGVTGLAVLAFLGAGYTQKTGKFADNVKRAVGWIAAQQDDKGGFKAGDPDSGRAHAVLALALCEAYGMDKDPAVGKAAQAAIDRALAVQTAASGWAAKAGAAPDTVTTAWFVAAFKSAKLAGLKVEGSAFQGAAAFLDKVAVAKPGTGWCSSAAERAPDPAATMAAVAARIFMGEPPANLADAVRWAAAEGRKAGLDARRDPVWLYFGTLACFQLGGQAWTDWNEAMKKLLLEKQEKGGPRDGLANDLDGSWPAEAGSAGGRIRATAVAQLCLEVYYRYLPMYAK